MHLGQLGRRRGDSECAMPTCSLPRGTARQCGQAELGPAASLAVVFAQALGCGILVLEPPSPFPMVTFSPRGRSVPACARPRQLFPSTSRPSPALGPSSPKAQADLPQRKGPGEGREGPLRSDRPERPKVHVDQGSEAALARALTLEKRPGRHLDAGASLPGLEPRLHYSLCVFGQLS